MHSYSRYIRFAVALAAMVLLCAQGNCMEGYGTGRYSLDTIRRKIENLSATVSDTLRLKDTDRLAVLSDSTIQDRLFQ